MTNYEIISVNVSEFDTTHVAAFTCACYFETHISLSRLQDVNLNDPSWERRLRQMVERVLSCEPSATIFIFGSFASGRFTAESDLDIAVIVPDEVNTKKFYDQLFEKRQITDWPLDIVFLKKSQFEHRSQIGGVCFDIRETGKMLHPKWELS